MLRGFRLVVEAGRKPLLLLFLVHGGLRGYSVGIDVLGIFFGFEDIGGTDGRVGTFLAHELVHHVALGGYRGVLADERVGGSHC